MNSRLLLVLVLALCGAHVYGRSVHGRSRLPPLFRYADKAGKIVGGQQASPGQFPYIVYVEIRVSPLSFALCGGSIISNSWLVTAAHCVRGQVASDITAVAGEHNTNIAEGNEQSVGGVELIIHEDYSPLTSQNDIALVKTSPTLSFNSFVSSISLPSSSFTASGDSTISGWGTTSSQGSVSAVLRYATVPVVSDAECDAAYGNIVSSMLCAGYPQGGIDTCQGDSGGPLVNGGFLAGLTSFGQGCAEPGFPGVYTEVAFFRSWISSNSGV